MSNSIKGQSLIEFLMTFPLVLSLLLILFYTFHRSIVFLASNYFIDKTFICLDSKSSFECKSSLEGQMKKILIFHEDNIVTVQRKEAPLKSRIRVEIAYSLRNPIFLFTIPSMHIEKRGFVPIYRNL